VRLPGQIAALVGVGACAGVALNHFSAQPLPLTRPVYAASASGTAVCSSAAGAHAAARHAIMPQAEAVAACTACSAGFVDARGAVAFANGHIPGAIHLPPAGESDEAGALTALRRFATVVVYDAGTGCHLADAVADRLRAAGFSDVRILDGSWSAWQAAGGPAESGACRACGAHEPPGRHL
jgi:3-mercaptopyruvate sulfurtransferase SseA